MLTSERKILLEVLNIYKDHPVLWNRRHIQYANRDIRKQAYDLLLEKYRTVNHDATIHVLKKKIDSLRLTYKRETIKVAESIARGDNPCYTPTLWYFNAMHFLEFDHFNESTNSVTQNSECDDTQDSCNNTASGLSQEDINDLNNLDGNFPSPGEEYPVELYGKEENKAKPKKRSVTSVYVDEGSKKQKVEIHVNDHGFPPKSEQTSIQADESEAFGKTVGLQLKKLDAFQRTVAEKLISEVIFYARLNKLSARSNFNLNADKYN